MSVYRLNKLFHKMEVDQRFREAFLKDREAVSSRLGLTPEERKAVIEVDIHQLYGMGVHPILLMHFAEILGLARARYKDAIADFR